MSALFRMLPRLLTHSHRSSRGAALGLIGLLMALLAPAASAQPNAFLSGLDSRHDGTAFALIPDGAGGYFTAAVVGTGINLGHVDASNEALWSAWPHDGVPMLKDFAPNYISSIDIATDGAGGVYVGAVFTDGEVTGLVVERFSAQGIPSPVYEVTLRRYQGLNGEPPDPNYFAGRLQLAAGDGGSVYIVADYARDTQPATSLAVVQVGPSGVTGDDISDWIGNGTSATLGEFQLVEDGTGGGFCVYSVDGSVATTETGIYAVRWNDGITDGWVQKLSDLPSANYGKEIEAVQSQGNLYALWNGSQDIHGQRLTTTGALPWGQPQALITALASPANNGLVACSDGEGGLALAAGDRVGTGLTSVYAQRILPDGTKPWGADMLLLDDAAGYFYTRERSWIANLGDDGFVVVIADTYADGNDLGYQIRAKEFDRDTGAVSGGGDIVILADHGDQLAEPRAVPAGPGAYVVTAVSPGELLSNRIQIQPPAPTASTFQDVTWGTMGVSGNGRGSDWADVDGDGDLDVFVAAATSGNKLFRNDGNSRFTDVTPTSLFDTNYNHGALWHDYDADGDPDLFMISRNFSDSKVFRNDGNLSFVDVTSSVLPSLPSSAAMSVSMVDFDEDGRLDLFAGFSGFAYSKVYTGLADGTFADYQGPTSAATARTDLWTTAWGDYDNDGDLDLFATHDSGANSLLRNDGGGSFSDVTSPGLAGTAQTRAAAWGDYDNDGDLDLYVGNWDVPNELWRNDGPSGFTLITTGPTTLASETNCVSWMDFDLDGDLDLFSFGYTSNWLFRNDGGTFVDATDGALPSVGVIAASWADYDDDGDPDLFFSAGQGFRLYRNNIDTGASKTSGDNWLGFDLSQESGHVAVGTRVRVTAGGVTQMRDLIVSSGFNGAGGPRRLMFGLGANDVAEQVEITWPDGSSLVQTNVSGGTVLHESQQTSTAAPQPSPAAVHALSVYPNPANPRTTVRFELALAGSVDLEIFDLAGRRVTTLTRGELHGAGVHRVTWNGTDQRSRNVSSGVYLVRMQTAHETHTQRVTLVR